MSIEENDTTHPLNMSADDLKATMASLDNEDAEARDDGADGDANAGADAGAGAGDGAADGSSGAAGEGGDDAAAAAAAAGKGEGGEGGEGAGAADGEGDEGKTVSLKAFNGLMAELRQTREEVKAYKAQQAALAEAPSDRDFAAERAALKEQWENGDIDTDEYNDKRDALVLEQADHRVSARMYQAQQAQEKAAAEQATQAWNAKVQSWEKDNADFLANPLRRKAVNDLLAALDSDPTNRMTDDELLAEVQKQAFDAFNWQGAAQQVATGAAAGDPMAQRRAASARAAAAASAAPPAIAGGVSNAAMAQNVNLEDMKPGEFKKLAKDVQAQLLGEEL